ncbi:protein PTCD3 homolog, mitochondrial [Bombyx mandarina]|uniref:Protein PTCD3 homolog, mitochondrial n=1 Tax=Bombyx mandarina TaxID=7092 RepID=A0A6J2K6V1_BOMMA|nr:protein PTCD3 homolog, mitochondrial [Bombyx mandarina]
MYSNIVITRQISKIKCLCRSLVSIESQKTPQSGASSDGISPPVRIQRGPTDILQALSTTVGIDPTAAHYKYHDDPYLIPLSNYRKRAYALAAEAGRKAAIWIRDEHADLFTTRIWDPPLRKKTPYYNADPKIEAFSPKPIYNDESKVTEEDLIYTIRNALIEDSIKVYQLLGGSQGVSDELKLQLLQLLCFYNEKEPDSVEWLEERWFSANTRERQAATWRLGSLADTIFTSMEPKSPEAYCAIIQGMAKYYQAERAYELSQEAIEKGIPLSTGVYNALLGCIGFLREGATLRIEALKSTLMQMKEQGLSPNIETLSACLRSISVWGGGIQLQNLAMQLVAEFRELGIQPGLSAYYYLLCLFCKERGPRNNILSKILTDLESRQHLEVNEPTDTNFFITAMGVCSDHLQDINMAERVHALLMKNNNYKLVGDAYKESIYYRHLVTVACRHAPFEKATEYLDTLIPNIYIPEPSVMEEIIRTLEVAGAGDRLTQAWSQIIVFGHAKRTKLVERLLSALCNCYEYQEEDVKEKIRSAAESILKHGETLEQKDESRDQRSPVSQKLSATALSNIIELLSDVSDKSSERWTSVETALNKLKQEQATGVPSKPEAISTLAEKAASMGKLEIAAMAVAYLAECGFEEAAGASARVLGAMLNRPEEEVRALLQEPAGALAGSLHPAALAVLHSYHLAKTGTAIRDSESSTSSESDSESSSDED